MAVLHAQQQEARPSSPCGVPTLLPSHCHTITSPVRCRVAPSQSPAAGARPSEREQVLENLSPVKPPAFMSPPRPQQAPSADASRAPTPPAPGYATEATSPAKRQHKRKRDSAAGEGGLSSEFALKAKQAALTCA